MTDPSIVTEQDIAFLERCVELAEDAVREGDDPFGSVLVSADGAVLAVDRNRERSTGDPTAHPEIALAHWAAANLAPEQRAAATVYTSGEHCPMCAAAHAWVGLGRIVYATSTEQALSWRAELGLPASPVVPLPITAVIADAVVAGPVPAFADRIRVLHELAAELRSR